MHWGVNIVTTHWDVNIVTAQCSRRSEHTVVNTYLGVTQSTLMHWGVNIVSTHWEVNIGATYSTVE